MGSIFYELQTYNLESFLNDVYKKECKLKPAKEEIRIIQEGIENLVEKIVKLYLEIFRDNVQRTHCAFKLLRGVNEIYFKVPANATLFSEVHINITDIQSNIIKVGSFYEKTKNKFPDEFDFIFLLASWDQRNRYDFSLWTRPLKDIDVETFNSILHKNEDLKYYFQDKKIIFDEVEQVHGPAYQLRFRYHDGSGEVQDIRADLVPAHSFHANSEFLKMVEKHVNPKSFRKEVLNTDRYLSVCNARSVERHAQSVTQTEVHFMTNILSKKHVKAYRILKILINGHGDGERLKSLSGIRKEGYSSYEIKTMMIYHHDECKNPDTDKIGECVIQILESIYKCSKTGMSPMLIKGCSIRFHNCKHLTNMLYSMIKNLKNRQFDSFYTYDNEKREFRSLSRQYLDTHYSDSNKINTIWYV